MKKRKNNKIKILKKVKNRGGGEKRKDREKLNEGTKIFDELSHRCRI